MYYFLGIVSKEDMNRGNFTPSMVLCRKQKEIQKVNIEYVANYPIILTDSYLGHEDLYAHFIDFRTIKGGLFWFMCNAYGERDGPAIFVTYTPIKKLDVYNPKATNEILSHEKDCIPLKESATKKILDQKRKKVKHGKTKQRRIR